MPEDYIERDLKVISNLKFDRIEFTPSKKSQLFIDELRGQFNEQIQLIKIGVESNPPLFWGSLGTKQFLEELINHPNLKSIIHDLHPFPSKVELVKHVDCTSSLYSLIGDLCTTLAFGGAYSHGTKWEPKILLDNTKNFVDEFLPSGYMNYHYYKIHDSWTMWFANVAWDSTFMMIDRNGKEINLICITDSD